MATINWTKEWEKLEAILRENAIHLAKSADKQHAGKSPVVEEGGRSELRTLWQEKQGFVMGLHCLLTGANYNELMRAVKEAEDAVVPKANESKESIQARMRVAGAKKMQDMMEQAVRSFKGRAEKDNELTERMLRRIDFTLNKSEHKASLVKLGQRRGHDTGWFNFLQKIDGFLRAIGLTGITSLKTVKGIGQFKKFMIHANKEETKQAAARGKAFREKSSIYYENPTFVGKKRHG